MSRRNYFIDFDLNYSNNSCMLLHVLQLSKHINMTLSLDFKLDGDVGCFNPYAK